MKVNEIENLLYAIERKLIRAKTALDGLGKYINNINRPTCSVLALFDPIEELIDEAIKDNVKLFQEWEKNNED